MSFWSCSHACRLSFQLGRGPGMDQKLGSTSLMRHLTGCEDFTPYAGGRWWGVWSLGSFPCSSLSLAPCSAALAFARLVFLSAALLGYFSIPQFHLLHYVGQDSSSPSLSDFFPLPRVVAKVHAWPKCLVKTDISSFLRSQSILSSWSFCNTDLKQIL